MKINTRESFSIEILVGENVLSPAGVPVRVLGVIDSVEI
jgi:hypothetical protein